MKSRILNIAAGTVLGASLALSIAAYTKTPTASTGAASANNPSPIVTVTAIAPAAPASGSRSQIIVTAKPVVNNVVSGFKCHEYAIFGESDNSDVDGWAGWQ